MYLINKCTSEVDFLVLAIYSDELFFILKFDPYLKSLKNGYTYLNKI